MEEREERIARNEALFRQVNERLENLNATFHQLTDDFQVVCECGDGSCVEMIRLPRVEYEAVRRDPARFIVVPGHVVPECEFVAERRPDYEVVEKVGHAAELAKELDPRS